jgi:hypothetical protein
MRISVNPPAIVSVTTSFTSVPMRMDDDDPSTPTRFAGRSAAVKRGRVAAAGHALATLRALGGAGSQTVADLDAAVQRGIAQGCEQIAVAIEAGEIFRAERQLEALLGAGSGVASDRGADIGAAKALAALAAGH